MFQGDPAVDLLFTFMLHRLICCGRATVLSFMDVTLRNLNAPSVTCINNCLK